MPKETVRLALVVQKCGQPEPIILWTDPSQDDGFRAAAEQNRVLTVKQPAIGTRKDFGVVGFWREKHVSYWVFPKPLDAFSGKRVIGINYKLLRSPKAEEAAGFRAGAELARSKRAASSVVQKGALKFQVTIRCMSVVDVKQTVEAPSRKAAKQKALRALANERVDFAKGIQSRRAIRAEKLQPGPSTEGGDPFQRRRRFLGEAE